MYGWWEQIFTLLISCQSTACRIVKGRLLAAVLTVAVVGKPFAKTRSKTMQGGKYWNHIKLKCFSLKGKKKKGIYLSEISDLFSSAAPLLTQKNIPSQELGQVGLKTWSNNASYPLLKVTCWWRLLETLQMSGAVAASALRGAQRSSLRSVFCPVLLWGSKPEAPFFSLFHFFLFRSRHCTQLYIVLCKMQYRKGHLLTSAWAGFQSNQSGPKIIFQMKNVF